MRTQVETTKFEFSHGRKPRGHGRWFFGSTKTGEETFTFSFTGTFSEGKKECQKHFSRFGVKQVEVLP